MVSAELWMHLMPLGCLIKTPYYIYKVYFLLCFMFLKSSCGSSRCILISALLLLLVTVLLVRMTLTSAPCSFCCSMFTCHQTNSVFFFGKAEPVRLNYETFSSLICFKMIKGSLICTCTIYIAISYILPLANPRFSCTTVTLIFV